MQVALTAEDQETWLRQLSLYVLLYEVCVALLRKYKAHLRTYLNLF